MAREGTDPKELAAIKAEARARAVETRIRTRRVHYIEHRCPVCELWYEPSRSDQRFCNPRCRASAHYYERR